MGAGGALAGDDDDAASFDGTSSAQVDLGNHFDLEGRPEFSVEARIKPAALSAVYPPILQKEDIDDRNHRQGYLVFLDAATSRLGFERWREDVRDQVVTIEPISGTRFTYVVATYDGVQMHLFMGGALVALGPATKELLNTTSPFQIGGYNNDALSGVVDEAAVYDVALDQETVASHYRVGRGAATSIPLPVA